MVHQMLEKLAESWEDLEALGEQLEERDVSWPQGAELSKDTIPFLGAFNSCLKLNSIGKGKV